MAERPPVSGRQSGSARSEMHWASGGTEARDGTSQCASPPLLCDTSPTRILVAL